MIQLDLKIFPINTIDNIVLTLKIIGWIYFPPIKYCTLVLNGFKPSQLACIVSRGGQCNFFWAWMVPLTPPLALFEAPKAL